MSIKTHSSVTSFTPCDEPCEVGDIVVSQHGAWSNAESDIHSVTIHDVANVTRRTQSIKGAGKVTTITITDTTGNTCDIILHRTEA